MSKLAGIKLASFIVGIVIPITITSVAIQYTTSLKPHATVAVADEINASTVDTFLVEYEQYGNMTVGQNTIRCDIANATSNTTKCNVYLTDMEGNIITNIEELLPSCRTSVFKTTWVCEEPNRYVFKLIYEVSTEAGISKIECPYVVLLNGGKYVKE